MSNGIFNKADFRGTNLTTTNFAGSLLDGAQFDATPPSCPPSNNKVKTDDNLVANVPSSPFLPLPFLKLVPIASCCLNDAGDQVAVGMKNTAEILLVDSNGGRQKAFLKGAWTEKNFPSHLAFFQKGTRLAECGTDGKARMWNLAMKSPPLAFEKNSDEKAVQICVDDLADPEGNPNFVVLKKTMLHWWEAPGANRSIKPPRIVHQIAFRKRGELLVLSSTGVHSLLKGETKLEKTLAVSVENPKAGRKIRTTQRFFLFSLQTFPEALSASLCPDMSNCAVLVGSQVLKVLSLESNKTCWERDLQESLGSEGGILALRNNLDVLVGSGTTLLLVSKTGVRELFKLHDTILGICLAASNPDVFFGENIRRGLLLPC